MSPMGLMLLLSQPRSCLGPKRRRRSFHDADEASAGDAEPQHLAGTAQQTPTPFLSRDHLTCNLLRFGEGSLSERQCSVSAELPQPPSPDAPPQLLAPLPWLDEQSFSAVRRSESPAGTPVFSLG